MLRLSFEVVVLVVATSIAEGFSLHPKERQIL